MFFGLTQFYGVHLSHPLTNNITKKTTSDENQPKNSTEKYSENKLSD